jgi:hypothetical protein
MPATKEIFKDAIAILSAYKEIEVVKVDDNQRRQSSSAHSPGAKRFDPVKIDDRDRLKRAPQLVILLGSSK